MSKPEDFSSGLEMFGTFHDLQPKKIVAFPKGFKIPSKVYNCGHATWIYYASKKWENKVHEYKHEHAAGVKFCWVDKEPGENSKAITVPDFIKKSKTLVRLGYCIGAEYRDNDGDIVDVDITKPYPDLYTISDGTALLIVNRKPPRIEAIIWGGSMHIEAHGIIG